MTVSVLWLFLTVSWVGLQCVIVLYPDHTHLYFKVSVDICDGSPIVHVCFIITTHLIPLFHIRYIRNMAK